MPPTDPAAAFLAAWHATAEQRSLAVLEPFVADDVAFSSPALFHPKRGKAEVLPLLEDVLASLEGYRVTRTWIDGPELLLEFEGRVGDRQLQGVDRISLDAAGRMAHLKVLIRPYHGLVAVMTAVGRPAARPALPRRAPPRPGSARVPQAVIRVRRSEVAAAAPSPPCSGRRPPCLALRRLLRLPRPPPEGPTSGPRDQPRATSRAMGQGDLCAAITGGGPGGPVIPVIGGPLRPVATRGGRRGLGWFPGLGRRDGRACGGHRR